MEMVVLWTPDQYDQMDDNVKYTFKWNEASYIGYGKKKRGMDEM